MSIAALNTLVETIVALDKAIQPMDQIVSKWYSTAMLD